MKLSEAKAIIFEGMKPRGYRVAFERKEGSMLTSDYFPDGNEQLLDHKEEAWDLAEKFAAATTGKCVNVYVVDDRFVPVSDRTIENR